ncbi:MAG: AarF/ABC1/UbiB kinase family protein, partial [Eudoraea sp.]|nr:AarF/ABC1/UbiB kinase family protein [Eudoraea sp.]
GVAESISSDLALVKPIAMRMFNIKGKDSEKYFKEVEHKLLEETDYIMELRQSRELTEACSRIPDIIFPTYYPELSSERILTMDWMDGKHLSEFTQKPFEASLGNRLGQSLWDFYMYQMHGLRKVHADPHPGNFLVSEKGELIAIDFGCVKEVPDEFYYPYFELAKQENIENEEVFNQKLVELEILTPNDTEKERIYFTALFREMLTLFTAPFQGEAFDFGSDDFWGRIAELGQRYAQDEHIRKMNGNRGSRHFLYINRTFFGLYNLLHDLKAKVQVNNFRKYIDQ